MPSDADIRLKLSRQINGLIVRLEAVRDTIGFLPAGILSQMIFQCERLMLHSGLLHDAAVRALREQAPPVSPRTTARTTLGGENGIRDAGLGMDLAAAVRNCGADDVEVLTEE